MNDQRLKEIEHWVEINGFDYAHQLLDEVRRLRNDTKIEETKKGFDSIKHPKHYVSHPSGVEAIQIEEHFNFCLGNVIKYVFRCDLKGNPIEDLKKAQWYLDREIKRREREATAKKD